MFKLILIEYFENGLYDIDFLDSFLKKIKKLYISSQKRALVYIIVALSLLVTSSFKLLYYKNNRVSAKTKLIKGNADSSSFV